MFKITADGTSDYSMPGENGLTQERIDALNQIVKEFHDQNTVVQSKLAEVEAARIEFLSWANVVVKAVETIVPIVQGFIKAKVSAGEPVPTTDWAGILRQGVVDMIFAVPENRANVIGQALQSALAGFKKA